MLFQILLIQIIDCWGWSMVIKLMIEIFFYVFHKELLVVSPNNLSHIEANLIEIVWRNVRVGLDVLSGTHLSIDCVIIDWSSSCG